MSSIAPEQPRESARPDDLADLVRAAQHGDSAAYGELYLRLGGFVHGVALAHARPEEAADLVQDAFLHGLAKLRTLREPAAFGAWIAQIARNLARMRQRVPPAAAPIDEHHPDARPQAAGEQLDGGRVLAAIRALPEAYREPLALRLVEGMSGEEIAARTGLTHGSVRVNLHKGMAMLRRSLGGLP